MTDAKDDIGAAATALRLLAFDFPIVEDKALEALEKRISGGESVVEISRRHVAGLNHTVRRSHGSATSSDEEAAVTVSAGVRVLWSLAGPWMRRVLDMPLAEAHASLEYYIEESEEEPELPDERTVPASESQAAQEEEIVIAAEEDDDDFVFESMDDPLPPRPASDAEPTEEEMLPEPLRAKRDEREASWTLLATKLTDLISLMRTGSDTFAISLLGGANAEHVDIAGEIALAATEHADLPESARHALLFAYIGLLQNCLSHTDNSASVLSIILRVVGRVRSALPADKVDQLHGSVLSSLRRLEPAVARRLYLHSHAEIFTLIAAVSDSHMHSSPIPAAVFGHVCAACQPAASSATTSSLDTGASRRLLSIAFDTASPHRSRLDALQGLLSAAVGLQPLLDYLARVPGALTMATALTRESDMPQHALWGLLAATLTDAADAKVDKKAHFNASALMVRHVMQSAAAAVVGPRETSWQAVEDARPLVEATKMVGWLSAWCRAGPSGAAFFGKTTIVRKYVEEYRAALFAVASNAEGEKKEEKEKKEGKEEEEEKEKKKKTAEDTEAQWRKSMAKWAGGQLAVLKVMLADADAVSKSD